MISKNSALRVYIKDSSRSIYKDIINLVMYDNTLLDFTFAYSKLINSNKGDLILMTYSYSDEFYFGKISENDIISNKLVVIECEGDEIIIPYTNNTNGFILKSNRHAIQE